MVSEKKIQLVTELIKDIKSYPIVGIVNFQNLPAQQLQKMRSMLKGKGVKMSMARKKILLLALNESGKDNIKQLAEKVRGMPALLFSKDNPFTLNSIIEKNKSEAPAKAGQTAPKDIVVKAGATSFAPGPIISELAAVGIKTKVENGKLAIISDTTVAKEGAEISQKLADTLKRLDIKPMEVGLDLVAVWEDGLVFDAKQLHIDEKEYEQNIILAAQWALNLALEAGVLTAETTGLMLQKAYREAKAVAVEAAVMTEETKEEILAKSEREALSVKKEANIQ
ncbi:MAG: 50S ribosomal protein L10 [Nanoarchaeota archaeon]|nr:50S ribosomal protein L10 [Nanoarchaeota archaeon]MBU1643685.1 50S ribosomal protein L10 [Nanoarchaeota archaeon]MBU1976709.1 50S ribosomal protein L10 [Nanoarchaeota archaeon]